MKKLLILFFALLLTFVSCKDEPEVHTHDFGEWSTTERATCTEDGEKVRYCSCGEKQTEVVASSGHTPGEAKEEDRVDATYNKAGSYKMVVRCTTCYEKLSETSHTIPALIHVPANSVMENNIDATCYSEGSYDMVVYCSKCNEELERTTYTRPVIGHTPATAVIENRVEATCTTDGSYDEVVYCSVKNCGELISKTTKTIKADHDYQAGTCTRCGLSIPGLYNSYGDLVASWDKLINTYGLVIAKEYSDNSSDSDYYVSAKTSLYYILKNNSSLKSGVRLIIDDSVEFVGDYAFAGCTSLVSVKVGNSATWIGYGAFEGCTALTSVVVPKNVVSIKYDSFDGCTAITEINVDENNRNYKSIDGNLYSKNGKTLIKYAVGKTQTSFVIPSDVTRIEDRAFEGCKKLVSVTIPNSVTTIGYSAFKGCTALNSVTVPDSVTSIETMAFEGCTGLKSVTLGGGITRISVDTFYECATLTSVTILGTVTSIGKFAFFRCNSLANVYYAGTAAEWANITVGEYNSALTGATITYNYQG